MMSFLFLFKTFARQIRKKYLIFLNINFIFQKKKGLDIIEDLISFVMNDSIESEGGRLCGRDMVLSSQSTPMSYVREEWLYYL